MDLDELKQKYWLNIINNERESTQSFFSALFAFTLTYISTGIYSNYSNIPISVLFLFCSWGILSLFLFLAYVQFEHKIRMNYPILINPNQYQLNKNYKYYIYAKSYDNVELKNVSVSTLKNTLITKYLFFVLPIFMASLILLSITHQNLVFTVMGFHLLGLSTYFVILASLRQHDFHIVKKILAKQAHTHKLSIEYIINPNQNILKLANNSHDFSREIYLNNQSLALIIKKVNQQSLILMDKLNTMSIPFTTEQKQKLENVINIELPNILSTIHHVAMEFYELKQKAPEYNAVTQFTKNFASIFFDKIQELQKIIDQLQSEIYADSKLHFESQVANSIKQLKEKQVDSVTVDDIVTNTKLLVLDRSINQKLIPELTNMLTDADDKQRLKITQQIEDFKTFFDQQKEPVTIPDEVTIKSSGNQSIKTNIHKKIDDTLSENTFYLQQLKDFY